MASDAGDDTCGGDDAVRVDRAVGVQSDDAACRHKDVEVERRRDSAEWRSGHALD